MQLNFAGICFTEGTGVSSSYNAVLVAASLVIAGLASYAALEMIARMRVANGVRVRFWQAGSAIALGGGIWSMHFMAMLAMRLPFAITYSPGLTTLSLVVVIAVVGCGLEIGGKGRPSVARIAGAGMIIGLGVAAMHYIGMAAILFPGSVAYTPGLWGLSILIAISAAIVALWLSMTLDDALERSFAAIIMAVAVAGMHLTGMQAAVFQASSLAQADGGVANGAIATTVGGITVSLVVLALVLVAAERKILDGNDRESRVRKNSAATIAAIERQVSALSEDLAHERMIEQILASVFKLVDAPMSIVNEKGEFVMTNPAMDRLLDTPPGALVGQLSMSYVAPVCRERISRLRDRQMIDRKPYSTDAQFFRKDGSIFCMTLTSAIADEEPLHRFRVITLSHSTTSRLDIPARSVVAAKIKVVGLEEMEATLGDEWAAFSERIMTAAERIINTCLVADESCVRSGSCGFLLGFGTASEETASERAGIIDQTLREALRGLTADPAALEIVTATATTLVPGDTAPGGHLANEIVGAALDARLQEIRPAAPVRAHTPFHLAGCLFEPVLTCKRGEFVGHYVSLLPSTADGSIAGIGLSQAELQGRILAAIEQQRARDERHGSSGLIFVDIRVETLLSRSSLEMLSKLLKSAGPAVQGQLVILLSRWPSGMPPSRVHDLINAVKPLCKNLGLHLDELALPKLDLGLFDAPYVAIDASQVGVNCDKNGKLERFVLQLHAKRARVLFREAHSMAIVRQLQPIGIDLVSMESRVALADIGREQSQFAAG